MDVLIPILFALVIFLIIVTVVGHLIWLALAALFRFIAGVKDDNYQPTIITAPPAKHSCGNCQSPLSIELMFCGRCGARRPTLAQEEQLRELEITLRNLERLHQSGALPQVDFRVLKAQILSERDQILFPQGRPGAAKQPSLFTAQAASARRPAHAPQQPLHAPQEPPSITSEPTTETDQDGAAPAGGWAKDSDEVPPYAHVNPPPPRRPFAEVLASFMEQSNIRWGEIIGGLLIIGCSTALVISLWAQISRVPTIKFLIFTSVTAALFGIGFYTEHHWKLPTTSRGILTIATLLVPLNFLAIAAVSSTGAPMGLAVVIGEILAPAIFLCLIYFAARVITPKWPHLLAAGALGSSIGQLLIRHMATPQSSAALLLALGAFPIVCYVGATGWMLKIALADGEIDDDESSAIFITLGTLTFAAILPFALLLYKAEAMAGALLHLAPLITLGGAPALATGLLLWRRARRNLVVTRTAGASIAILGAGVAIAGMLLAWPNPASIVPAALFNFALFIAIALYLDEPRAHVVAAACLTLGCVVAFHVVAGHVPWQQDSRTTLFEVTASVTTGQYLALIFVAFVLVKEWFRRRQKPRDSFSYLLAACGVAVASMGFLAIFGIGPPADPYHICAILLIFAAGAFCFAWRERFVAFTWAGATIIYLASAQACHSLLTLRLPWESSVLLFAVLCTAGALTIRRFDKAELERLFVKPLQQSGTAGVGAAIIFLFLNMSASGLEPSLLLATHVFILAAVLFGLLIVNRAAHFFIGFQVAIAVGAVLLTKYFLEKAQWYAAPNAWLHPWALQTQGIVLGLICFAWIAIRLFARRRVGKSAAEGGPQKSWMAQILIDLPFAFDHLLAGSLLIAFVALLVLGSASGISQELTRATRTPLVFDAAGFPHQLIFGIGSLLLLGILLAVMLANRRERNSSLFSIGAVLVLWAANPLVAGRFESQVATASAARWSLALFLLAAAIAYSFSSKLRADKSREDVSIAWGILLFVTLGPLILLTLSPVVDYINYVPARGPQSGIFRAMGGVALYGVPLTVAVAALALHAVRERSAVFAFAAGLLVNFTVTSVQIVSVAGLNGAMNRVVLVNALQLNAIAAACVALAWITTRNWWMQTDPPLQHERVLLTAQKFIGISFLALFIVPVTLRLVALPDSASLGTFAAGAFNGWLGLTLVIAAAIAFNKLFARPLSVMMLALSMLAAGSLIAFWVTRIGVAEWVGLHALLFTLVSTSWFLLAVQDMPKHIAGFGQRLGFSLASTWARDTVLFTSLIGGLAVLCGLRGPFSDPQGAWWSIGTLLSMCVLAAALNLITLHRAYLYAAGILLNLSLSIWLIKYRGQEIGNLANFTKANVLALSLAGIVALILELRARRRKPTSSAAASFHNLAALWSLLAMGALVTIALFISVFEFYRTPSVWLDWLTLGSLMALMFACLWDRAAAYAVAGLYLVGILMAAQLVLNLGLAPSRLIWSLMIAGAVYLLIATLIWRARAPVLAGAARWKIPVRIDASVSELKWLNVCNSVLVVAIAVVALWSVLTFAELPLRVAAALAVFIQAFTLALMAEGRLRRLWQRAAVTMFLTALTLLSWSLLTPGTSGTWLNRAAIMMFLMFATVAVFGAELDRLIEREPDWSKAVRDCIPVMVGVGIFSLGFVLATEVYYQIEFGVVRVAFLALLTVALTLAAAAITCIFFALSPEHDPLGLSERWRGSYVYVAEVAVVLLFMHIRLTMPWLFSGFFQRYWPLGILAIAYAGVAISELLKRRQIPVLARPLERTGAFLPLLPVIGFWIAQSQVEYSTVLFVVGGLYGLLSILRRSFFFGLAAALAGNGGLWYLLHETSDYHFFQHPQAWLIPVALSVLIAAHLNRKDFSPAQMTAIRYMCLATIYVSSTADIFINGVAQSPWLPLVLAGLSVAGVFAGIIFRIQAFLLLGSTFLLLAIATMINYASVNFGWTWLWYVAGIITGALIIATFAVFEKKRAEVLRVVDELKDWKG